MSVERFDVSGGLFVSSKTGPCVAHSEFERLEDKLAIMAAELERIAGLCAGSEAEWLIHGVLSQLKSEDQKPIVLRNMPKLPAGWKFTGEYRQPREGEYYFFMGEIKFCKGRTAGWYPIVHYVGAE